MGITKQSERSLVAIYQQKTLYLLCELLSDKILFKKRAKR